MIELYGEPVLLTHGDALCTADHSYQRLRAHGAPAAAGSGAFSRCRSTCAAHWPSGRAPAAAATSSYTAADIMDADPQARCSP